MPKSFVSGLYPNWIVVKRLRKPAMASSVSAFASLSASFGSVTGIGFHRHAHASVILS